VKGARQVLSWRFLSNRAYIALIVCNAKGITETPRSGGSRIAFAKSGGSETSTRRLPLTRRRPGRGRARCDRGDATFVGKMARAFVFLACPGAHHPDTKTRIRRAGLVVHTATSAT